MPAVQEPEQLAVVRKTQFGPIEGVDDRARSRTLYWLGVPFAKPPVGALRWKAPQDPDPWTSVRPAKTFASACVQWGVLGGPGANNTYDATIATTLNQVVGSEDCLYLNIWRPATRDAGLPVIVFIHGGYGVSGYTADPMYNGTNLSKAANAIVVTVNYRLGVFGSLYLQQLKTGSADEDSGNFGLLDNIKALQWLRQNISEFGGNANNVTLMGQSSGAINVWALMVAAPTRRMGLFHRVMALSSGVSLASNLPTGSIPALQPASYYAAQGKALLHSLLIAEGKAADDAAATALVVTQASAQIADYLRSKSGSTILTIMVSKLVPLGLGASGPIPDGALLPADPIAAFAAGEYTSVPVLASNTGEEGKLVAQMLALSPALGGASGFRASDAERFKTLYGFDPNSTKLTVGSLVNEQYLPVDSPQSGYNARTALLAQILFIANRDNVLNTLKARQSNVWYYRFDWAKEPPPWNEVYGAAHAIDLLFVFGNFGPSLLSNAVGGDANKGGRIALSEAMMASIAAFARSGDPNNVSLGIAWPVWPKTLVFDATLAEKVISVE